MFNENFYLSFRIHGGAGQGEGVAAYVEQLLANIEILLAKQPDEIFAIVMPGFANLANIHPMLVHFPIVLLTFFFIIDVLGSLANNDDWRRTAGVFLYLGTVSALATVAAGLQAAATVPHSDAAHEIMMQHKMYGYTVASLAVLLSLWRLLVRGYIKGIGNFLYLGLSAITCIVLMLGADLGGLMVFRYGVGVSASPPPVNSFHHGHSH